MRAAQDTDGRSHSAITGTIDDHHPAPRHVSFSNTAQSLPPGTTWDLDVSLPSASLKVARVQLMGPVATGGGGNKWREGASVHVTTAAAEAVGHSHRDGGGFKRTYCATYAKSASASQLSHKVFDANTGSSSRYISLQDAWIVGSILRLRFRNHFGGSSTLSVKGSALLW